MRLSMHGRALLAAIVVAAAAVAGGIAYAAIPDSSGVIHGCYNPNGANAPNGTTLNIFNSDASSCKNNQTEISWNQTGPQGDDGVSVTSASLSPGDTNCPAGGSQFTAAGNSITYACNGAKGDTGAAGPSNAFTNYGDGQHHLDSGNTQTVASVTIPAGSYTLSGSASVSKQDGSPHADCFFDVPGVVVNGHHAGANLTGTFQVRIPVIGDATLATSNSVRLRCHSIDGEVDTAGEMIATQVGTITPAE